MYVLIHQNNDLCDVTGYVYTTVPEALDSASKHIGLDVRAVPAEVRLENGPTYYCDIVAPTDGSTGLCCEGHMTLIAQSEYALNIAVALTRRNRIYGQGKVVVKSSR
jgi:hypothetical protein